MADATLTKLVQLFSAGPAVELRCAALKVAGAVGSAKEKSLVKSLLAVFDDPEIPLRIAAIEAAGHLKIEDALPRLEGFARAGGAELEPAVHAASQLGAKGTKRMSKVMDEATPVVRARIADVLARSGTGNALVVTAHALLDPDPKVADGAARALATQVPTFSAPQRHALAHYLADALNDKSGEKRPPRTQAALLRILGIVHDGKADDLFWNRIAPPAAPEVRVAALHALGAHAKPTNEARLQKLLACAAENDFPIVAAALMILKNVPVNAKNGKHWLRLIDAPDVATRRFAIERLRGIESPEVAAAFVAQIHSPDRGLREEVLNELRGFALGRQALLDQLLDAATPDEAWFIARALAAAARELSVPQRTQILKQAFGYHEKDDRRAAAAWFLLREADAGWTRDRIDERAEALRKKKSYTAALGYYRLLGQDPACSAETRLQLAATGLKESSRDLSAEARANDPALQQFARLLQDTAFDVPGRLAKAKWLEPEDLLYLGFHFAEQTHRARDFGRQVLEMVVQRAPKAETAKQAKRKLKSAGLV